MNRINNRNLTTRDIAYIAMFSAILVVCSWISIPLTVPFTLQTLGVFLSVGVLGGKKGTLTVLTYILLGAIGVPVFSGFSAGIAALLGTTGGYIVGFLLSAVLMWVMEVIFGNSKFILILSMLLGLLVCYVFGTIWFMVVYTSNIGSIALWTALTWCVIPYVIPDIIKIVIAYTLSIRIKTIK